MSITTYLTRGPGRIQVYSNRPLQVYGYIVPLEGGGYGIQIGGSFTRPDAPVSGEYKSKAAAKRAILEAAGLIAMKTVKIQLTYFFGRDKVETFEVDVTMPKGAEFRSHNPEFARAVQREANALAFNLIGQRSYSAISYKPIG